MYETSSPVLYPLPDAHGAALAVPATFRWGASDWSGLSPCGAYLLPPSVTTWPRMYGVAATHATGAETLRRAWYWWPLKVTRSFWLYAELSDQAGELDADVLFRTWP